MTQPANEDEYLARFQASQKVTGFGPMGVTMHTPYPFCAAPDWSIFKVIETEEAMQRDTTCRECGRSARAIVKRERGAVSFEFVQTGGDDPPEWLPPMRRVSA